MSKLPDPQIRLCIVNRRASDGFSGKYHRHPFYEMGFVLEGVCDWQLPGRRALKLNTGQVVVIPPERTHRERAPTAVRLGWLGFESSEPIEPELLLRPISINNDFETAQVHLRRIGEELACGRLHGAELNRLALRSLLLLVGRAALGESVTTDSEPGINPHQKRIAASVAAYLERNVMQPLTLTEVARYHNLSGPHLSVIFKNCYGMTPTSYRLRHRIEHAKSLLKTRPDLGLKNIAVACGFTDATHFGKEFRRWTGQTPSQAR